MASAVPRVLLVADARAAARVLADEIAELARERRAQGRALVLGLATGRTQVALYDELAARTADGRLDLSGALAFNLDEYCGLAADDPRAFAAWMRAQLFERVGWPRGRTHVPAGWVEPRERPAACAAHEAAIRAAGGIELQLLGLGRNGHIGFNEPGSGRDSRTREVELHPWTVEDAAADFGSPERVPRTALTMGVATILEARRVRLCAFGAGKRTALARALSGPPDASCPASFLLEHPDALFLADAAALGGFAHRAERARPDQR